MRIGIDATCLPPALAGAGRYIQGVIHGLSQIDRANEYFVFIKEQDAARFSTLPANLQLVRLPLQTRTQRLVWQHARAGAQARQLGLEVWHGMHYTLPHFASGLACVATFHDLGVFHHPQLYPLDKRIYFRHVMQQTVMRAQQLISVSEATTQNLRSLLAASPASARRPHVVTIHSGVAEEFFQPVAETEKARVRRAHQLTAPFLLFVGTFEKRKNLVMLLHAFAEFCCTTSSEHLLVLAGQPGNGSAEVAATIAKLGLRARVRVLGYVPEADLPGLYQSAELLVMPSLYEGFGFPLLEAMAGGVVALAADNSSLRELAQPPHMLCAATPTAWAHKMATLVFDKKLRAELQRSGVQRALQFSWKRSALALREVYAAAAEATRGTRSSSTHFALRADAAHTALTRSDATPRASFFPEVARPHSDARNDRSNGTHAPHAHTLAAAIQKTLAYSDLFEYPLTAKEVHHGLIEHAATELEVLHELETLCALGVLAKREQHYCLPGREHCIALRERRRLASAEILQRYQGILRVIKKIPFMRTVALSGTLAFQNAKGNDDLDLFLIVERGRLWTVYLSLVVLLKMLGQRRDVCLNCLLDTANLAVTERDFFIAHQIAFLRPLHGTATLYNFWQANAWCLHYLPQMRVNATATLSHEAETELPRPSRWRKLLETILRGRAFDGIEALIFKCYRRRIQRLTPHLDRRAIVAEAGRIKLFTNNHRFHIQERLEQRLEATRAYRELHQPEEHSSYAAY